MRFREVKIYKYFLALLVIITVDKTESVWYNSIMNIIMKLLIE